MEKSAIRPGVVYAYSRGPEEDHIPVKVIDAEHTYSLREWQAAPGQRLTWEQKEHNRLAIDDTAWARDEVWLIGSILGRTHGILVAGKSEKVFAREWHSMTYGERDAALAAVSLRSALDVTGLRSRHGWVGRVPVGVIDPAGIVGEWDDHVRLARELELWQARTRDAERRKRTEARGKQRDETAAERESRRLRKRMRSLQWCLGLTIAAMLLSVLAGGPPAFTAFLAPTLAITVWMGITNSAIKKSEP